MYKSITIRRMNNPDTRELMRQCNAIELALKRIKAQIKSRQKFHKAIKNFYDPVTQEKVDDIFKEN